MPRRHVPWSLKRVTLMSIARNMEKLWLADYQQNFLEQGTFLFVIGPFEVLTPCLIQDLINLLVEEKLLKRFYLHVLIDSRLERLDLSVCKFVANKDSIINLVSARCQKLTSLNIASCNQVSARTLADLVESLPNIQSLNLRQTKCNDQVLSRIGSSCKALRDLNLFGCAITDMGLMSLSVSFEPRQEKCSRLAKLDIACTAVTNKGVEFIVKNLHNLQYLVYPDICEVLYRLHHQDNLQHLQPENLHQLRALHLSNIKANLSPVTASIEVSCAVCPLVTEVHFVRGVTNDSLLPLSQLQNLRVLNIANNDEELVTFEDGIFPLLQVRGENLHDLALFEVNNLDLGAIAACCPNLRKFSCLVAGFPQASFPLHSQAALVASKPRTRPFSKLEHARVLLHTPENTFPAQYVKILTTESRNLKSLHLAYIQSLTDEVLQQIFEVNKLEQIEKVILESCHHVSGESVGQLLDLTNNLQSLVLKDCREITRRDYDTFQRVAKSNNYDLNIEWV